MQDNLGKKKRKKEWIHCKLISSWSAHLGISRPTWIIFPMSDGNKKIKKLRPVRYSITAPKSFTDSVLNK